MGNYEVIEHEISKFGKLEMVLPETSARFFRFLKGKGVINHLKEINQLGFISKSHPGNNHKRWDYVCLQLHLLHKLKHATFRVGLGSDSKSFGLEGVSHLEILQIAVLFSSIGHLPGTLAFEIALFEVLNERDEKKKEFLKNIDKDLVWRNYASKVFQDFDYYKVKVLVALNFTGAHLKDIKINDVIKKFFKNAIEDDEPDLRVLKHIYFRVRQLSFLYLDSFNSDFPFQLDISKMLINLFNYDILFNPNSSDYNSFLHESETNLSKKIYISPKSCELLEINRKKFKSGLKKQLNSKQKKGLQYSDFLTSILKNNNYEVAYDEFDQSYQFYISKEEFSFLNYRSSYFDYKEANRKVLKYKDDYKSLLRQSISNKKDFNLSFIFDQRKELFFINLFLHSNALNAKNFNQFLLNYFNLHQKYLFNFCIEEGQTFNELNLSESPFMHITHHYCRKIFLQLMKMIFKYDKRLNAYIKFNYQIFIKSLIEKHDIYPSGFLKGKERIKEFFEVDLSNTYDILDEDIKNNIGVAKSIIDKSHIKKNMNAFYCLFPIELENRIYDPKKLYECLNPEKINNITDIDFCFVLFNKSQFELYFIEGKKLRKRFESRTRKVLQDKIINNLSIDGLNPEINYINENGYKGGYFSFFKY